jgi:hypothetical protein
MRQYFEAQLSNPTPLTFAMLHEMNQRRKDSKSKLLSIDRIGRSLVYFIVESTEELIDGGKKITLEVIKAWDDEVNSLSDRYDLIAENVHGGSMPMFKPKEIINEPTMEG